MSIEEAAVQIMNQLDGWELKYLDNGEAKGKTPKGLDCFVILSRLDSVNMDRYPQNKEEVVKVYVLLGMETYIYWLNGEEGIVKLRKEDATIVFN